jgi:predicted Zn-dependent peptidase
MSLALGPALGLVLLVAAPTMGDAAAGVARWTLPNGVRLLVREDGEAGVVAVSLQVRAGSGFEAPATAGITNFLHRVMLRGSARRNVDELVEAAERIGGTLDASGDVEYAEVRGSALARHWEALLGLVAEVALTPTLPPEEVERERRLVLGQIQTRAEAPFSLAFDALLVDLYGPHPYALPALGRREVVEGLSRADLLSHHRAIYRPDRLVVAMSGRVEGGRVRGAVQRLFGEMAPAGDGPPAPPPAPTPTGARRVLDRPAQQAQVLVGFLGPGLDDPDYAAVKVLTALLGGGMGSRLFAEVRDRQGLAYALGAVNPSRAGPAPVVAYAGTARENVTAAEAAIRGELARAREALAGEEELARAKAWVLGSLAMDRRTNARHAWYLGFFEIVGAGWDFPERHARAVEAVTAPDVLAAARRHLARATVVVLEPR